MSATSVSRPRSAGACGNSSLRQGGWQPASCASRITRASYALRRVDGAFEAVYSRHAGGYLGFPTASHDEGPCRDVW